MSYLDLLAEQARRTTAVDDLRLMNSPPWWLFERDDPVSADLGRRIRERIDGELRRAIEGRRGDVERRG